jgi:hypothetical protein
MKAPERSLYQQAIEALSQVTAAVQRQEQLDLAGMAQLAGTIVDSVQGNDQLVVQALSSPPGPSLVTNLINVSILGTKVGIGLGYYGAELRRLALAGLLHDIGIFAVPQNLLTKVGRLSMEERALVEQHPRLGHAVIERHGPEQAWLAEVVLQAHERGSGQGYPNRLKGREINELAQIIGLVDIFDALISPRPYRRRLLPHEAIRELINTERTAFPREIMKGLVEQLSVFPLGTKVRLNSGEEGVVVRITPSYPLRPVLRLSEEPAQSGTAAPRYLDLSLLPHEFVATTVDSPAPGRLTFPPPQPVTEAAPSSASTSEQFAALLESLDAIAGVIQAAVQKSAPTSMVATAPSVPDGPEQLLRVRREILGLFVLEAREWLHQIQAALERLDETSEQPRRIRLASILWQGVNNLARSAATVGLTAVEHIATTLLPLLQAVGRHERSLAVSHVASLREGLLQISRTVQELEQAEALPHEIATGPPASAGQEIKESYDPIGSATAPALKPFQQSAPGAVSPSTPILDALRQLHIARGRTVQPVRDVLETVIQWSEGRMNRTTEIVDARTVGRILQELDELDEQFLALMQRHVPAVLDTLRHIDRAGPDEALAPHALEPIFDEIEILSNAAERVAASNIAIFLNGLKTFLRVTVQQKPFAVRERLEAVKARLVALVPLAQQWVDIGRVERAAIFDILPLS